MMVEILAELQTGETEDQLRAVVEEFVWRLTGKETIYQMIALAEQVEAPRRHAPRSAGLQAAVPRPPAAQ